METAVTGERDATVVEVQVTPGDRVEPNDLSIELG
jgi:pyruvate carboxylase